MKPRTSRLFSLGIGLFSLLSAAVELSLIRSTGFPDGYITELEKALRPVQWGFLLSWCILGAYLLLSTLLRPASRHTGRAAWISMAVVLISFLLLHVLLPALLSTRLDHGQGG